MPLVPSSNYTLTAESLVAGSIPAAATNITPVIARSEATRQSCDPEEGIRQNNEVYLSTTVEQGVSIFEAIQAVSFSQRALCESSGYSRHAIGIEQPPGYAQRPCPW